MNWLRTQETSATTQNTAMFDYIENNITKQLKDAIFKASGSLETSTKIEIDIPEGIFMDADFFDTSTMNAGMKKTPNYHNLVRTLLRAQTTMKAKYHEGSRKLQIQIDWDLPHLSA